MAIITNFLLTLFLFKTMDLKAQNKITHISLAFTQLSSSIPFLFVLCHLFLLSIDYQLQAHSRRSSTQLHSFRQFVLGGLSEPSWSTSIGKGPPCSEPSLAHVCKVLVGGRNLAKDSSASLSWLKLCLSDTCRPCARGFCYFQPVPFLFHKHVSSTSTHMPSGFSFSSCILLPWLPGWCSIYSFTFLVRIPLSFVSSFFYVIFSYKLLQGTAAFWHPAPL